MQDLDQNLGKSSIVTDKKRAGGVPVLTIEPCLIGIGTVVS